MSSFSPIFEDNPCFGSTFGGTCEQCSGTAQSYLFYFNKLFSVPQMCVRIHLLAVNSDFGFLFSFPLLWTIYKLVSHKCGMRECIVVKLLFCLNVLAIVLSAENIMENKTILSLKESCVWWGIQLNN